MEEPVSVIGVPFSVKTPFVYVAVKPPLKLEATGWLATWNVRVQVPPGAV